MSTLVVNCGSTSLKCRFYDDDHGVVADGNVTAIGEKDAELRCRVGSKDSSSKLPGVTHDEALDALCDVMLEGAFGASQQNDRIVAVGHRVVHGGERFREACVIDTDVEREIEELFPLAPLHNPQCLLGIRTARRRFRKAQHVAVFDTAFHQSLPEEAFLYAIPYDFYERNGIRRYGFHGSSHRSVSARAIEMLDSGTDSTRIITCHLGAGCSTAAVRDGRSIDTSMGMTPLEGLVMATRSGDIDPGVFRLIAQQRDMSLPEIEDLLLTGSGLLGLSGETGDMRKLLEKADAGDAACDLAIRVFTHRVRKYIGAHLAVLGGADAIVLTGGAGENSPALRARIFAGLDGLGMELDTKANDACCGTEATISTSQSRTAIYVIPSNEEFAIATETRDLLARS